MIHRSPGRTISAKARAALRENRAALLARPMLPVSGNAQGDVTLVEFFDYQYGFCKRSLGHVMDLPRSNAILRVVWREPPMPEPGSAGITQEVPIIIWFSVSIQNSAG